MSNAPSNTTLLALAGVGALCGLGLWLNHRSTTKGSQEARAQTELTAQREKEAKPSAGRARMGTTTTPPQDLEARNQNRRDLYPPINPYKTGFLKVSDIHTIYYEECGNPKGKPVIFVHGGPGGGLTDYYRQYFDPQAYRIILFDQRGAGQSTPFADLRENTTWDLVADMEKLRVLCKVDKWVLFGGSWGSTLALAYAQTHPERCLAIILRGVFLLRKAELEWFYQDGASWIFPDAYAEYSSVIPQPERGALISAFHRRLIGADEEEKLRVAKAWSVYEMTTSRLHVDPDYIKRAAEDDKFAIAFARIETHYFVHGGFFTEEGQLLKNAHKLKGIPGVIVQGRYDIVCPAKSAWDLHNAWPEADMVIVSDAGHSCKEPGILSELVKATDKFR